MIAHHRIALAALLICAGYVSPAAACGNIPPSDPPGTPNKISQLPEEIGKALIRLCGEPTVAAH
jgi:hypothetical protein